MYDEKLISVAGKDILCCVSADGRLVWPKEWTDELLSHDFLDAASSILAAMDSAASSVPWIIGSASKNLFGVAREDSKSHMLGYAFDMSPMYSDTVAVQPDGPLMGLAWNVISLMMVSAAASRVPFVVEGDHLHVQPTALDLLSPNGGCYCVWTFPSWYEWTARATETKLGAAARNSVWYWDLSTLTLTPPSMELKRGMLSALVLPDLQDSVVSTNVDDDEAV